MSSAFEIKKKKRKKSLIYAHLFHKLIRMFCKFQINLNSLFISKIHRKPKKEPNEELPKDYKKVIGRLRNGYDATMKKKQALTK